MRKLVERLAVPIAAYLLITVVMPIANGAARRPDFVRHTAFVLAGCIAVIGGVAAANKLRRLRVGDRR